MNNKKRVSCVEFTEPNICIPWQLNEDDFVKRLEFEMNESLLIDVQYYTYQLEVSLS